MSRIVIYCHAKKSRFVLFFGSLGMALKEITCKLAPITDYRKEIRKHERKKNRYRRQENQEVGHEKNTQGSWAIEILWKTAFCRWEL